MKKILYWKTLYCGAILLLSQATHAKIVEYSLVIRQEPVNLTGKAIEKITVNGSIPGPVLHFVDGDEAVIHVTNKMDEETSVHWHGLLLPGNMDGVPGFNGFPGIKPGETFSYQFKLRQEGTYWYHAHSMGQEQEGLYGSIVILPKEQEALNVERDYVIVLSDYSKEDSGSILSNLKMSSDYYQYARRTIGDFFSEVKSKGFKTAWQNAKMWGQMRMLPTDLSDVTGYTFLINGKTSAQNWTGLFSPGERVRLRFINASAMTFYDVRIPGLKMIVVAADGQPVEPVTVDEFRFGVAETYDAIVTPSEDKAYAVVAEPIDRTGFALATLAPREDMKGESPIQRPRALLTMADMGMSHEMSGDMQDRNEMGNMTHMQGMDHAAMGHVMPSMTIPAQDDATSAKDSGWVNAGTPKGDSALKYSDLHYLGTQKDTRQPQREVTIRLGGNMERYIWTLNGKKYEEAAPINLEYGERIRLTFINETMMAHPMHLHGMFVQLDNGQPIEKLPNKHTIIVPPGSTSSVLLTANEPGEWAFHCHLLYHMMAGMMNKVVVAKLDPSQLPSKSKMQSMPAMDHAAMKRELPDAP